MSRLGGNRRQVNTPRSDLPMRLNGPRSVAVIGGGIAGLTAAALLAERGFSVTLIEKKSHLGGKAGSWVEKTEDGFSARIDHGFHGFFRQYFNLRSFMEKTGSLKYLVPIDDYLISSTAHGTFSFKGIATTPVLNMLSLRKTGLYRLSEMMKSPESSRLLTFLSYHPETTFQRYDGVSFLDFSEAAALPPAMRMMFNTFSRSFFADPDLMSSAELIKSFHSYFLSNDLGLLYDYLATDFETGFTGPARRWLEDHGAAIFVSRPVTRIERVGRKLGVLGQLFDFVVLAADAASSRQIAADSDFLRWEDPQTARRLGSLQASQGYAVLRIWTDRKTRMSVPVFIATEKKRFLDSITLSHRVDPALGAWARDGGGGVYELHCYALPRERPDAREVRDGLLSEMTLHLPDLAGMKVIHEHLQMNQDFTAFHTGMHAERPGPLTAARGLVLAGDWVKLPVPAMLMEAACTSAVIAVNSIIDAAGLRQEPLWSVPGKGLLAR